ncbi:uncharacterized protein LOC116209590 [Punica granatum]|uniref:DUF538 domain-containing protein n=2 Tax=Punica granatum TaxID=22663 RepID=A0A218WZX0_PUNGR|nr:uncharacterized protein LOC116209590 [Punica granatum]OWM77622.1 hypothetical protein CDL15_Pgr017020 [Punica granatum]PKH65940.1 hypothetical protein CRG98_050161 [Punica granatum]
MSQPSPPPLVLSLSFLFLLPLLPAASASTSAASIQSLLLSQGLPGGLFPESVKSFSLDPNGLLEVILERPCLAKFETKVYFDSIVRANLTYGRLQGLEGLAQQELFLWLPVKDIIVNDPSSGLILFDIGLAHKQLSLSLFEDPPPCKPQGDKVVITKKGGRKSMGFGSER